MNTQTGICGLEYRGRDRMVTFYRWRSTETLRIRRYPVSECDNLVALPVVQESWGRKAHSISTDGREILALRVLDEPTRRLSRSWVEAAVQTEGTPPDSFTHFLRIPLLADIDRNTWQLRATCWIDVNPCHLPPR